MTLETESLHFVVTGGTGGCHNDNARCRQRRHLKKNNNNNSEIGRIVGYM